MMRPLKSEPPAFVNGRKAALALIDGLLAQPEHQETLRASLERKFQEDPFEFFQKVVTPLIPKKMIEGEDKTSPDETARDIRGSLAAMDISTADGADPETPE